MLRATLGLLVSNKVQGSHAITILGVQVGAMFHKYHQHGLSPVEGCKMKRGLVLIVFLIDVVSKQQDLLEAIHAVGYDRIEYIDWCTLILLCIDWFHDLENLLVSLLGLR